MCRHKGRTQDDGVFQAAAAAVELLEIADERAILERKREHWVERKFQWAREIFAQVIFDPGSDAVLRRPDIAARCPYLENFPWIENVFRIEHAFDLAHNLQQLITELLAHVFSACDANSVLR